MRRAALSPARFCKSWPSSASFWSHPYLGRWCLGLASTFLLQLISYVILSSWKPRWVDTSCAILSVLHGEYVPETMTCQRHLCSHLIFPLPVYWGSLGTIICPHLSYSHLVFCIASIVLETMICWHLACSSLMCELQVWSLKSWFLNTSRAIISCLHCKYILETMIF